MDWRVGFYIKRRLKLTNQHAVLWTNQRTASSCPDAIKERHLTDLAVQHLELDCDSILVSLLYYIERRNFSDIERWKNWRCRETSRPTSRDRTITWRVLNRCRGNCMTSQPFPVHSVSAPQLTDRGESPLDPFKRWHGKTRVTVPMQARPCSISQGHAPSHRLAKIARKRPTGCLRAALLRHEVWCALQSEGALWRTLTLVRWPH